MPTTQYSQYFKLMKHSSKKLIDCLFLISIFTSACSLAPNNGIQLRKHSEEMKSEVKHFIPIDMPITKAKKILEDSQFSCKDDKNSEFSLETRDVHEQSVSQDIIQGDFLSCSTTHFLRTWAVVILYKSNKVTLAYAVINDLNF